MPLASADVEAIIQLLQRLRERGIAIDILINNAGHGLQGPFVDGRLDAALAMLQLDVVSLTAITHTFAQDIRTRGRGKILLVASLLAYQGVENFADGRMNGFGGCNTFTGSYKLDEAASRISFDQVASTMMACPSGMEVEEDFHGILRTVDNYSLNGDRLTLNRASFPISIQALMPVESLSEVDRDALTFDNAATSAEGFSE